MLPRTMLAVLTILAACAVVLLFEAFPPGKLEPLGAALAAGVVWAGLGGVLRAWSRRWMLCGLGLMAGVGVLTVTHPPGWVLWMVVLTGFAIAWSRGTLVRGRP